MTLKDFREVAVTNPGYTEFNHPIDWTWFEIWHHEGRRARHGASMMAPDYTHWHGTYDLAKHWMTKYIPELREIIHDFAEKPEAKQQVAALLALLDEVQNSDAWKWSSTEDQKVKADRLKRREEFQEPLN
jgi:hypothetical protein